IAASAIAGGVIAGGGGSAPDHSKSTKLAPIPQSAALAPGVNSVIGRLDRARADGRARLLRSRTPEEQAARAADLARAYDRARQALGRAASNAGGRAASASIVAALDATARSYRDLAANAR